MFELSSERRPEATIVVVASLAAAGLSFARLLTLATFCVARPSWRVRTRFVGCWLARRPRGRPLVVDCADLVFVDCTAVGVLVRGRARAAAVGTTLTVVNANGVVDRVLDCRRWRISCSPPDAGG